MKTIKDIFSKIIKFILKITGDDLSIYAAQASFFIIISVIPFSMLVLSIIKLFINIDINSILHTINSFAPAAISTFLTETITDLFTKSGSVQVISVTAVSTLWLASRGVMALYTGLNKVYRSRSKNYFIGRLISILYTLAFIAAIYACIYCGTYLDDCVFRFRKQARILYQFTFAVFLDIARLLFKGQDTYIYDLSYLCIRTVLQVSA